jgi:cytochrome c biogenesis protein CcdA
VDFIQTCLAAFGFGVMHALTPCAHSWPVLLPLSARAHSGARPGIWFGIGMILSSIAVGALIGAFGGAILTGSSERVEEIIGGLIALLGLALLVRPQWMHGGHIHGSCAVETPEADATACGHKKHQPFRFFRFGRDAGSFALGVANMAVPCWSNFAGVGLTAKSGSATQGAAVLGIYGLAAAITTVALLVFIHHGLKLTQKLASPRFEAAMLRLAGLLMLVFGLMTVFHVGHHH